MQFISAEEFLKQPVEVQKVFLDWWIENNTILDICHVTLNKNNTTAHLLKDIDCGVYKPGKDIYPLLTEGQLRQFIENKTGCIVDTTILKSGYKIYLNKNSRWQSYHVTLEKSLIKAYWKVALDIAKQC